MKLFAGKTEQKPVDRVELTAGDTEAAVQPATVIIVRHVEDIQVAERVADGFHGDD